MRPIRSLLAVTTGIVLFLLSSPVCQARPAPGPELKKMMDWLDTLQIEVQGLFPAPQFSPSNYNIVKAMQDICNQADEDYEFRFRRVVGTPDEVQFVEAGVVIHAIMAAAAATVDYDQMYELHMRIINERLRFHAYDKELRNILDGQFWFTVRGSEGAVSFSKALEQLADKLKGTSSYRVEIDYSGCGSCVISQSPRDIRIEVVQGEIPDAQTFVDSLSAQLQDPIVRFPYIEDYEAEAKSKGIIFTGEDYFWSDLANQAKIEFLKGKYNNERRWRFRLRVPPGEYVLYINGKQANRSNPNWVVARGSSRDFKGYRLRVSQSGERIDVEPIPWGMRMARPVFELLDFRMGTNSETRDLEGNFGGRMFQRFGKHLALQTQGQFDFRNHRDLFDLDRILPTLPTGQKFLPREKRRLTDCSSREFQLDIGPVVRFGRAQFAAIQSLRYVRRDTFDKGGTIGQMFFNAGYLFNRGQVGFFATRANMDEAVVKTVQFDQVFFEETYLKVTDQVGVNLQVSMPKVPGYLEGTFGYLNTTWTKGAAGGTVRYVWPIPKPKDRLSLAVEVGYNESFIKSSENTWRMGLGLRFGKWIPPSSFKGENAPVPVMVPGIRYETLTRVVRRGNSKPIADAGPDQANVDWRKGDVILDGSKSHDPDDDAITFKWTQTGGPAVQLNNADTANPRFTAANAAEYTFQLVVKDTQGSESDPDTVRVTTLRIEQPVIGVFIVTPSTIRKGACELPGEASLKWKVQKKDPESRFTILITNADTSGTLPLEGERKVSPDETTTYTLSACNVVNECVSATVTLTVRPCLQEILSFTATPPEILKGQCSQLAWEVKSAEKVTLTNKGTGEVRTVNGKGTLEVCPTQTTVYTLTACNTAGECVSADVTVTVKSLPTIVTFKADPPEILEGRSSTLSWVVSNADRVTLTNGEDGTTVEVKPVDSKTVTPKKTTVYTLTACKAAGECVSANVTVTVKSLPTIVTFKADPPEILEGRSSTLSWVVNNADQVTLTNREDGKSEQVRLVGSLTVTPKKTTVYTLTACKAAGECVSANVTVTVKSLPTIVTFKADPPEILEGGRSTLSWVVNNADRVTLTNGEDGTTAEVDLVGSKTLAPRKTTVYTLTACKAAGECVSANVTVTVKSLPTIVTFKADPPEILEGRSSTLSWVVNNADRVTLTNGEDGTTAAVNLVGSKTVTPTKTTVYTLTACKAAGECVSANVTVTVKSLPTIVTFKADPPEILEGRSSTLSWVVNNADRVTLTNGEDGTTVAVNPVDTKTVTPKKTTVYTLTACKAAGECVSANVTVTVKSLPTIVTFKADPPEILEGRSSTLSWVVNNADRVTLTNGEDGTTVAVNPVDTKTVTPKKTTVYTLTACKAAGECVSANVTVTVKSLPTIVTFKADPPEVLEGKSSTLTWEVKNADRVTLTNREDGKTERVRLVGSLTVTPTKTTVYTLTACKAAGECVSANVTVTVKSLPTIVTFKADPPEILEGGRSTLSWVVNNADRVTLTNGEDGTTAAVNLVGSKTVTPTKTTVYTLTACKAAGECVSAHVTVTVAPCLPQILYFIASPRDIRRGNCSELTFEVKCADTVTLINRSTGKVIECKYVNGRGWAQVCPLESTAYLLTACNRAGKCTTEERWVIVE